MDDEALYAWVDEVLGQNQAEIDRRNAAPYDGVMGTLDDWIPGNFHREFHAIRDRLLSTYEHAALLDYIAEVRAQNMAERNMSEGEFVELPLSAIDRETDSPPGVIACTYSPEGMLDSTYSRPRTPFQIMADVLILAHFQEATRLGPVEGLALLTDTEHAKTVTIGANNRVGQSKKAKLLRGKVGDDSIPLDDIISQLASERDELGGFIPAPDLWEPLFNKLEEAGGAPRLARNPIEPRKSRYEYSADGKNRHITRGRFETRIGELRR